MKKKNETKWREYYINEVVKWAQGLGVPIYRTSCGLMFGIMTEDGEEGVIEVNIKTPRITHEDMEALGSELD